MMAMPMNLESADAGCEFGFFNHGFYGFQNASNRFGNRFHNLFIIRVNPCNPWFISLFSLNSAFETTDYTD
jgi:hypothetical protein